jgi:hypothetical protein
MRLGFAAAFALALPLLAACSNDQAPPKLPAEAPAASTQAAATPAAPASAPAQPAAVKVPAGAAPLIGTWAAALESCGDEGAVTVITATNYTSPAGSCDISLEPTKDGAFATSCGGDQMVLTPVFAPTGEGINVVVGEGKRQTVLRCTR